MDIRQRLGLGGTRPSMQYQQLNPAFQSDPRRILGQTLMGQGTSTAPVRTPLQGLGRLSSALVGAYLQRKAGDAQVEREGEYRNQLASALSGLGDNVPSAITAIGSVPGNELSALNAAASYQATVAAREPKTPVQMFNRKTRQVIPVIPGSPEQTQAFKDGFEMGNLPNPQSGFMFKDGKQVVIPGGKEARALRDVFVKPIRNEEVKFTQADTAYKNAANFVANPTGSSDTALIYNFFTALDPGGRVTDSEAEMAQRAQAYGQQFQAQVQRVFNGGVLGDTARQDILKVMKGLVDERRNKLQSIINNSEEVLTNLGFTPQNTFTYYPQIFSAAATVPSISNNPDDSIVGGEQILPADGSVADPSITNATDDDLLRSLF